MIITIIGFMVLFMAVDYGRKEDSKFPLFSWKWFIIIMLVTLGTILIRIGNEKEQPKPRIHIEKEYNPKPSFQQTSFDNI